MKYGINTTGGKETGMYASGVLVRITATVSRKYGVKAWKNSAI